MTAIVQDLVSRLLCIACRQRLNETNKVSFLGGAGSPTPTLSGDLNEGFTANRIDFRRLPRRSRTNF